MPLAAILVCALLVSPSAGLCAHGSMVAQATAPEQDAPPTGTAPQEAPKPEPEAQPDSSSLQAQPPAPDSAQPPVTPAPDAAGEKPSTPATSPPAVKSKKSSAGKAAPKPGTGADKVVVRNGSTQDSTVQFSSGLSKQQASRQLRGTDQLMARTEANLKKIEGRQLTPNQQEMAGQIRKYMQQAKAAAAEGDPQRAHNLAFKAHLLSDELVKQ